MKHIYLNRYTEIVSVWSKMNLRDFATLHVKRSLSDYDLTL